MLVRTKRMHQLAILQATNIPTLSSKEKEKEQESGSDSRIKDPRCDDSFDDSSDNSSEDNDPDYVDPSLLFQDNGEEVTEEPDEINDDDIFIVQKIIGRCLNLTTNKVYSTYTHTT